MAKLNNRRVYPDANHQPCHLASFRKKDALERQAAYSELTIQQKLDLLDSRLGKGLGAVKQRARLASLLNKRQDRQEVIDKSVAAANKSGALEVMEHQTSELPLWKDSETQNKKKGSR
jgi:G3E family GTPase